MSHIAVQRRSEKTKQEARSKRGVGSGKSIILVFSPLLPYDGIGWKIMNFVMLPSEISDSFSLVSRVS